MNTVQSLMQEALALAARGRGRVEPNPMVGAVVLDASGHVVGRGYHEFFGGPHAEIVALTQAGSQAQGGTLIITLEPCCHHGKTPPCTEAILAAGIVRVIAAIKDPDPRVAGKGFEALRAAGVQVEVGECAAAASVLNAPFIKLQQTGKPWVHLKWAMSLDGRVATRTGESQWITNSDSRAVVHELRGRMDAILVGRGTVWKDDPQLTARPPGPRQAARVVITISGDLPEACQLQATARDVPVIVYTAMGQEQKLAAWAASGAEIVGLPVTSAGLSPSQILKDLGQRRFTNVLIEGGPGLLGRFVDADEYDEVHVFIAPKLIGGADAPGPLGGLGVELIQQALTLETVSMQELSGDWYIQARRSRS